jgi:hypothetical protein
MACPLVVDGEDSLPIWKVAFIKGREFLDGLSISFS